MLRFSYQRMSARVVVLEMTSMQKGSMGQVSKAEWEAEGEGQTRMFTLSSPQVPGLSLSSFSSLYAYSFLLHSPQSSHVITVLISQPRPEK